MGDSLTLGQRPPQNTEKPYLYPKRLKPKTMLRNPTPFFSVLLRRLLGRWISGFRFLPGVCAPSPCFHCHAAAFSARAWHPLPLHMASWAHQVLWALQPACPCCGSQRKRKGPVFAFPLFKSPGKNFCTLWKGSASPVNPVLYPG